MTARVLHVTVRIDFGPDLTDEDRTDIADSVVSDMMHTATHDGFSSDHEVRDITFHREWRTK